MALLTLEEVSYGVGGERILEAISLTVERGQTVGVMGSSGGGKTTLLRLIVGLIRPDRGRIVFDGVELTARREAELLPHRRRMGMVFQGSALFDSMTVAENVGLPLREHERLPAGELRRRVDEVLRLVGMDGVQAKLPEALSGGMRKRVAIARALVLKPALMLYDEPTAGLDPVIGMTIEEVMRELEQEVGVASLLVSHDVPSVLRVADQVAFLARGQLEGPWEAAVLPEAVTPGFREFLHAGTAPTT